ncbi:hypothetical protein LEN26_003877 [Aphanomyces euteiches]|nr:hypothetical protein LEN26_003877 [Aphanomyces euteiches]
MSETPRSKFHVLRPAVATPTSIARPPALDCADGFMRPVLQSKKEFQSPRRPSKPLVPKSPTPSRPLDNAYSIVLPEIADAKPDSRGEGDSERQSISNQLTRPRSNGPEAGDIARSDQARQPLASDLYFELQRQDTIGLSPRGQRQSPLQRHLYHDKMQQKYHEMRVLRARIKQLESALDAARQTSTSSQVDVYSYSPPLVADKASSPAKAVAADDEFSQRERLNKLERHLALAKDEIATLNEQLNVARTNDKAKMDTLQAKLELERAANKVLGERVSDADAALRLSVARLTEAESALARERIEREAMTNQLSTISRQAILDHRRHAMTSRVKGIVSMLGKGTLQTKLDIANHRLSEMEIAIKQVQMEALAWKKEAMLKQTLLEETQAIKAATTASDSAIARLLDFSHHVPDVVFHGARILDGQTLLVQVVRQCEPFALHFVAYEGTTAQEDMVSFYADDIAQVVVDGDKYILQPQETKLVTELVERLFASLTVGFKNGTFYLLQRCNDGVHEDNTAKICIYRGSLSLSGMALSVVVNELYRSAFAEDVWSLEITATSPTDEREWSCNVSMDQVCRVCPHFQTYQPHTAKDAPLHTLIDANEELLQPLLRTLAFNDKDELVSTLTSIPNEPKPPPASAPHDPDNVPPPAPRAVPTALVHRALKTIRGVVYYLTLRELWDAHVLVEATLLDAYKDSLLVHKWNEADLISLLLCAAPHFPTQTSFKHGIDAGVRQTLVLCITSAMDVVDNRIELNYTALAKRLAGPHGVLHVNPITVGANELQVDVAGPLDPSVVDAAVHSIKYPQAIQGVRLRDRSFGLLRLYRRSSVQQVAYVVKLVQLSASSDVVSTAWLVADHRLPLEFTLALWSPRGH